MAKVTVKIAGLSDLSRNMKTLSLEVNKKLLRGAARAGAKVVKEQAKKNALAKGLYGDEPVHMVDAIDARRIPKASKDGLEVFAVGVFKIRGGKYANTRHNRRKGRVGKGYEVDPPEFYWKFHEFGAPGRNIPKRAFLVPAFDARKMDAAETMKEKLARGIDLATRKLRKGPGK